MNDQITSVYYGEDIEMLQATAAYTPLSWEWIPGSSSGSILKTGGLGVGEHTYTVRAKLGDITWIDGETYTNVYIDSDPDEPKNFWVNARPPVISLYGTTNVCKGSAAAKATASPPYTVRATNGWEWIKKDENGDWETTGTFTDEPIFTTENLEADNDNSYTYKVRVHYVEEDKYDDSTNDVEFFVIAIPIVGNKTTSVCSGETFIVTPSAEQGDVLPKTPLYDWDVPANLPDGVTLTKSDNRKAVSGTITNTTDSPQTVEIVVTPRSTTASCEGNTFTVTVTVYPKANLPNREITICSGESITDYDPAKGTAFEGKLSYALKLEKVELAGSIANLTAGTTNNTINISPLVNMSSSSATITYTVTPTTLEEHGGCDSPTFTLVIIVHPKPTIEDPGYIYSGQEVPLVVKYSNGDTASGGTFSTSDPTIAQIDDDGVLKTNVDPNKEGKGGIVTIAYTTSQGCTTEREITITPRTKKPGLRWEFDGVCPIDEEEEPEEGEEPHVPSPDSKIATPWNVGESDREYFVNHVVWDSLVVVVHKPAWELDGNDDRIPIIGKDDKQLPVLDDDGNQVLDENGDPLMQWKINEEENVKFLKRINWYADEACTQHIRQGLDDEGVMTSFWQNETFHPAKTYWATVTEPDYHPSEPLEVTVHIEYDLFLTVSHLYGYVQPEGTAELDLIKFLKLEDLDESQKILWYDSETDALNKTNERGYPGHLDPTVPTEVTYWLVKADIYNCRSLPTEFKIKLVAMPTITLEPATILVCPGEPVQITATIANGTPPYDFTITNMNTGVEDEQTGREENTYTFTANPQVTVTRRVTHFADAFTESVTYIPYGLRTIGTGYYAENNLSVVVTEITGVFPNSGPTDGGTYKTDPADNNPIDKNGIVTITGSGFNPFDNIDPLVRVTFGGIPAGNVRVVDNNTITCTPPPHLSGNVIVGVEAECAAVTLTDGYRYDPINLSKVTPDYGPVTGGTTVVIRGTGLMAPGAEDRVSVTIGGIRAKITSVSNISITCITGKSTESLLGSIVINNGEETRSFADSFTYYPVKFIENGLWSEYHKWETQTNHHILPYAGAAVQIMANCMQNVNVDMDSITVSPGRNYSIAAGMVMKANVFTLQENASFLNYNTAQSGNMMAVQQNVEHRLAKGRNWYVSSPVEGGDEGPKVDQALGKDADGNDLQAILGNEWRVQSYHEPAGEWLTEGTDSIFYIGLGYTAYSSENDIAVKFSGKYNDGDQQTSFNVTGNNTGAKRGFNLVGNPFPSYWRWSAETAQAANLYSTIWYRTQVGEVYQFWSYNASGNVAAAPGWEDATPTGSFSMAYVPPMQAFWVRMRDTHSSGILTFKDSHRAHADHPTNLFRSTRAAATDNAELRPFLRLTVDDGLSIDEAVIYADAEARADFDARDSDKWFTNQGVELFSMPTGSSRALVINSLETIADSTEVLLGFQADEAGAFCLHAKEILNLDTLDVFLVDKWRRQEINLRTHDYNFTSSSVPVTDRFAVVFRASTPTGNDGGIAEEATGTTGNELLAYTNTNKEVVVVLYMPAHQGREKQVEVFDIAGRKITQQPVVVGARTVLGVSFSSGVYLLRAGGCTTKVVVE